MLLVLFDIKLIERKNKMNNYIKIDNLKIKLTDEQVREIQQSFGINMRLADVPVGETFKVSKYEFIVLEHSKETTAVILKRLLFDEKQFGKSNNYDGSFVDALCNEFADKLAGIIGNTAIVEHTVDLTADDGLKDYGKIKRRVSLITAKQYRRYVEILDKHKIDAWWWLTTAYSTPTHNAPNWVKCVSPSGCIGRNGYCNDNCGVRPFCILKSNIFVSK